jgi:hypothetical protein
MKITDIIVNKIPTKKFNGERTQRVIEWFGKNISTPENRLIIGVSALASQPFIDLYNKDVDEKTRYISCARTIAKTVSGTIIGVAIRLGFTKLTQKYSELSDNAPKAKKFFTPSNAPKKMTYAFRQYQNTMGMLLAVGGLLITNFAIDAPLTVYLTNILTKHFENHGKIPEKKGEIK